MLKKILAVLAIFFAIIISSPTISAQDQPSSDFASSYDVLYDVSEDGTTTITEKVALKNLTSQFYANQFKLTIGATQIFDIKGSDPAGPLEIDTQKQDTSTTITIKFNQQVAGLGKVLPWTLQFKSNDFAQNLGKVWEIRAPRISSSTNLESYNLTISVPTSFGEPTLISPTPRSQTVSQGKLFLTFDKEQLKDAGVSASFGTHQLFDFDLAYHLQNDGLVPVLTNIALPPDTSYQDIIFQFIDPRPINVTLDKDGNYLAWYKLGRNQKLDIRVLGSAKIYSSSKVEKPTLDENLRKIYTKADKYWEKDHPQIVALLDDILGTTPPQNTEDKARQIYRYVVGALSYDQSRLEQNVNNADQGVERFGAVTALNTPKEAVCMEFTDLFIALSRAAGIPARELDGYAYTANTSLRPLSLTKDVLHAWPEYWDGTRGWVMIDPTWENTTGGVDYFTKLDLNHFVFAIKGVSSTQPIPAGSYKFQGIDTQDVGVTLSENDFLGKPQIKVSVTASDPILAGIPSKVKVTISNVGNALYPPASFFLSSEKIDILNQQSSINMGAIPPFGNAEFEFNIRTTSLFESFEDEFKVRIGEQEFNQKVSVKPFLLFRTIPLIILSTVFMIVAIYGGVLGGLLYRRRVLKTHLTPDGTKSKKVKN
ncbi:MAG: transglutaminase-like domain-containing protein [Candidatus Daviesbacteria bacterium]|nr:transglutaminase-like domain-containing protein [Candidatus Daviesbacteria bacterium]